MFLLSFSVSAAAQVSTTLSVVPVISGAAPTGIDFISVRDQVSLRSDSQAVAIVANSGDNTVSFSKFSGVVKLDLPPQSTVVRQVASPFGVSTCGMSTADLLVTSPARNSVTLMKVSLSSEGSLSVDVRGIVQTGSQPHSAACAFAHLGIVSNFGDNTLTFFDSTFQVTGTLSGVPGSRGVHGIAIATTNSGRQLGWIAGTDANVITIVDLLNQSIVTQIPISRPTALAGGPMGVYVASASSNSITAYDATTFTQLNNQYASVPNPQDIVFSPLGNFAISGGNGPGQESLWRFDFSDSAATVVIHPIPGAIALAAPAFTLRGGQGCCPQVFVTSTANNAVYVVQQAPSSPSEFAIRNAASFASTPIAAGSLVSVVQVPTGAAQNLSAASVPLPRVLGGVTITIGGTLTFDIASNRWLYSSTGALQAPLLFVGPSQVNFQIPSGINPGNAIPAQLTKPDGTTLLTTFSLVSISPGLFSVSMNGQGQGAVLNDDYSQNGIPQVIPGAKPALRGSVIQIFATGGGETNPPLAPGAAAPTSGNPLVPLETQPTVMIGGIRAEVTFSGMAPGWVGLWQINATVPQGISPGNAVSLIVSAGGVTSNIVTIAVQ